MLEAALAFLIGALLGLFDIRSSAVPLSALMCTALYFLNNRYVFGSASTWFGSAARPPAQVSRSFLICYVCLVFIVACGCVALAFSVARAAAVALHLRF